MQIINQKNRLVPSLIGIQAKHLTQGIGTEKGRGKAHGSQLIDNFYGQIRGNFVFQGYSYSSFLHVRQSIYP